MIKINLQDLTKQILCIKLHVWRSINPAVWFSFQDIFHEEEIINGIGILQLPYLYMKRENLVVLPDAETLIWY